MQKIEKTDAEWRSELTPEQYAVLRRQATEAPFTGSYALTKDAAFPKRMGRPEEYGRMAIAIVENPMLNGSTIRLDGGQRFAPK